VSNKTSQKQDAASHSRDLILHSAIGSAPRLGKSSANEMALKVEGAVYGGVHADDALGGSS
jgi:hypothetical protein